MEDINILIDKAYNLIVQNNTKQGALSPNGISKELLHHINIEIFEKIEDIIAKAMKYNSGFDKRISNSIHAATVFWFMEDLCRINRLTPYINLCNCDILSYYYSYHAMHVVYEKDIWKNVDSWRYKMIKVLIRYFSRFYKLIDANADMLLPNNKKNNAAEKDIDNFLDYLLISLIKDSGDMFFYTHTDLVEVKDVCQQKIDKIYKDENINLLIKKGQENQYKLALAIQDYYCL